MTLDIFTALFSFALITVITPGPNNLMLMASGTNFGFRRTIPHMFGIGLGFPAMVFMVGLGVFYIFDAWPITQTILTICCIVYLLYLAWKIANAAPPEKAQAAGKPLTFLQSAAFQWVNPKAWSMALTAITVYAPDRSFTAILWVAGTYVLVSCISTTSWSLLGQEIRRFLKNPRTLQAFNIIMALLLLASVIPALYKMVN